MPADAPTILATSGGITPGERTNLEFGPLVHHAVALSGATGRPRVCTVTTASGDDRALRTDLAEAGREAGFDHTGLALFPMPNVADVETHLLAQDVIWVHGGSVANLLAVWQVHDLGPILHRAWRAGVVLGGVSAGSICWFLGGTTDSWGHPVRPVTTGLGFLPYGNGVHYDSEEDRRPAVHALVGAGTLPTTYCTDDGVGLHFRDTAFVEAVGEVEDGGAYVVRRDGDTVVEERLPVRLLG